MSFNFVIKEKSSSCDILSLLLSLGSRVFLSVDDETRMPLSNNLFVCNKKFIYLVLKYLYEINLRMFITNEEQLTIPEKYVCKVGQSCIKLL